MVRFEPRAAAGPTSAGAASRALPRERPWHRLCSAAWAAHGGPPKETRMQIAARCLPLLAAFALVACGHEAEIASGAPLDATAEGTSSPGAQPASAAVP